MLLLWWLLTNKDDFAALFCGMPVNMCRHPFTISSASDDLVYGPRICLETGEEVVPVPRPRDLRPGARCGMNGYMTRVGRV